MSEIAFRYEPHHSGRAFVTLSGEDASCERHASSLTHARMCPHPALVRAVTSAAYPERWTGRAFPRFELEAPESWSRECG